MLSQEELEKVYQENFPVGISLEAAAERLAAMDADYVDDIREMFCNRLLREWSFAPLALPVFLRSVTYLPPNDIHHLLTGKSQRLISRVFQRLISCP